MEVRRIFVPDESCLLASFDYKKLQPLVLCHYSQDDFGLETLRHGKDIYDELTTQIPYLERMATTRPYDARLRSKAAFLGRMFGRGESSIAEETGMDRDQTRLVLMYIDKVMPNLRKIQRSEAAAVRSCGFTTDMFGRHYHLPKDKAYAALNSKVQGTEAGIMKRALVAISKLEGYGVEFWLANTIHDEIVVFVRANALDRCFDVHRAMCNVVTLRAPLSVDFEVSASSWGELEKLDSIMVRRNETQEVTDANA